MRASENIKDDAVLRVLQVTGAMNLGGAETMIMNVYRTLDTKKIQFDFVAMGKERGYYEDEIEERKGKVFHIPRRSESFLGSMIAFYRIVKSNRYTTCHFHTQNAFLTVCQILVARLAGANNIIVHSHSTSDWRKDILQKLHLAFRPMLRALTNERLSCGEDAAKWLYGSTNRVTVVPLPVICKNYLYSDVHYQQLRKKQKYDNAFIFVHTGRFCKAKNHEFLLDIFCEISKKKMNAVLFLLGDGELRNQIVAKVKALHLEDRVVLWGNIPDVGDKLIMSDAFLFPSLYEGFPTVVLEAQAAGLPCYISDTITPKIAETDLVKQISLKKTAQEWCDFILTDLENIKIDRKECNRAVSEKYDVSMVKNIFTDIYYKKKQ